MSIFVSIASFCDPRLEFTIRSLYATANNPKEVFVGVIDQNTVSIAAELSKLNHWHNISYMFIDPVQSKGVGWARRLANDLYDNQDYFLQIDAHTSFSPGWDDCLINHISLLSSISPKPILTIYPAGFMFDDSGNPVHAELRDILWINVVSKNKSKFDRDNPVLHFQLDLVLEKGDYVQGYHISCGFIFTLGAFVRDILYDTQVYFNGEEQSLTLRAFTNGWDIFHPKENSVPLQHLYKTSETTGPQALQTHWRDELEQHRLVKWWQRNAVSVERFKKLLTNQLPEPHFSLGNKRSLEDFKNLSGIDYVNYMIVKTDPKIITIENNICSNSLTTISKSV